MLEQLYICDGRRVAQYHNGGCSSVWLERLPVEEDVEGSNPFSHPIRQAQGLQPKKRIIYAMDNVYSSLR